MKHFDFNQNKLHSQNKNGVNYLSLYYDKIVFNLPKCNKLNLSKLYNNLNETWSSGVKKNNNFWYTGCSEERKT